MKHISIQELRGRAPALARVIDQAKSEDSPVSIQEINAAKAELLALLELETAADSLNVIVEGVRNERWASEGRRLKDTPEWCAFYCAFAALKRVGGK